MSTPLEELETALSRQLSFPAISSEPRPDHLYDVIIIGAGQTGLTAGIGLMREGVTSLLLTDAGTAGFEGPWATFARMRTLRTPKGPTGVDCGIPDLTVSRWYEAKFGHDAWAELPLIPTEDWMDYLRWVRKLTRLPIANGMQLLEIRPDTTLGRQSLMLHYVRDGSPLTLRARKLVLATGYAKPNLPGWARQLPKPIWAHSSEQIDFARLAGRTVAVIGAGASAFDNAATAAEAGAVVHQFVRREELPTVNVVRWMDFAAFGRSFRDLSDATRRAYLRAFMGTPMPPPPETLQRVQETRAHTLHLGARDLTTCAAGRALVLTTSKVSIEVDFLIFGTGFNVGLETRDEIAPYIPLIKTWADANPVQHPTDVDRKIDAFPYLGASFELQERAAGNAPWLGRIHILNSSSVPSMGPLGSGGINGLKFSSPRLVRGLVSDLRSSKA